MEMYGKIRCVSFPELVGGGIISKPSYDKKVRQGVIRVVRPGKGAGSCALIDYESLPSPVRQAYDDKYPNAMDSIKEQFASRSIHSDAAAMDFYRSYEPKISRERQEEYVLNAEVMNEMRRVEMEMKGLHKAGGYTHKKIVWDSVLNTCGKLRELYGHTLPANPVRLKEKYNAYKRLGYVALVNKNTGNQVARKIAPAEARLLLKLRLSKVPVYTYDQIFDEYNRQAVESGLTIIKSPTTIKNYLNAPEVMSLWYAYVYGMQKWKGKYSSQMKTEMPSMRDSLWYGDGTKLNLYYKDEHNKMRTTSVYEVIDAYSEVFLGYDISPKENFNNQYKAWRMAVETAGMKPYETVTDNQGSQKSEVAQGFFKKICRLHKYTMPYNGQSKTIENAFYRFQAQILHKMWNFTGQNIQAVKLESKPNIEFIEQNAYALPTLAEMMEIYKKCREEWNNAEHPATGLPRIEMYRMSQNPETSEITEADKVRMFWIQHPAAVTYTNYGIRFEVNRRKYHFDVYGEDGLRDERWALSNTDREFTLYYDPLDMLRVELWESTASGLKYSAMATPKVSIHRNTQERTPDEDSYMRRTIELNKMRMANNYLDTERFCIEEKIGAEFFGLSSPKPKNVSKKDMERFRARHEREKREEPDIEFATLGEYEKALSNVTLDELGIIDRMC
ncbi:MAG: hypothetical protein LBN29_01215 [Mediterranea sp.]|jgi:hypothetical protein|nr:hypothetical protein [Mediterranea sp.]